MLEILTDILDMLYEAYQSYPNICKGFVGGFMAWFLGQILVTFLTWQQPSFSITSCLYDLWIFKVLVAVGMVCMIPLLYQAEYLPSPVTNPLTQYPFNPSYSYQVSQPSYHLSCLIHYAFCLCHLSFLGSLDMEGQFPF